MTEILTFYDTQILVVGDIMLDVYKYGCTSRISPEAPVPVVQVTREKIAAGGAANVAANLRALGCNVELAGYVGTDTEGKQLRLELHKQEIGQNCVVDSVAPTISKTRILADRQHIIRYDNDSAMNTPIHRQTHENSLISKLETMTNMRQFDAVVVSDYNKGAISEDVMRVIKTSFSCPILCDIKPQNAELFKGVFCITPNLAEAQQLINGAGVMSLKNLAMAIKQQLELSMVIITISKNGIFLLDQNNQSHSFSAHVMVDSDDPGRRLDVTGAGDTVLSVLTACIAKNHNPIESVKLSNLAAGIVVSKTGTATCSIRELRNAYIRL